MAEVLAAPEESVVAFGGGAVLDAGNRDRAREAGVVVWLQASPKDLARRVSGGHTVRPLLAGPRPAHEVIAEMLATREPAYRAAAHHLRRDLRPLPRGGGHRRHRRRRPDRGPPTKKQAKP